jgi:7-cyano-7-deazaguanine synthase
VTETSALVLFSGGQDSTTCLAWALERYDRVETVGFTYGQRHFVEMPARQKVLHKLRLKFPEWSEKLDEDTILTLPALATISDTALTRNIAIEIKSSGLPSTFVPGRNLLFFTYAAALGWRRGITTLVGGMCETDFSGYPDCRNDTLQTLAKAISLGLDKAVAIDTPLMFIDKAETWALADKLGGAALLDIIAEDTHTCYLGERQKRHPWGYGCGKCPACELRAKGWAKWKTAAKD